MGFLSMKRNQKSIIYVLIIFLGLIFLIVRLKNPDNKLAKDRILNYEYQGTIVKKYRNKNNHNSLTIELSTGKNVPTFTPNLFNIVQLGDSLSKDKNTFYMEVYRKDSLFFKFNHLDAENFMHNK